MTHTVESSRSALVQRLRWRSRRGMLELELALKPFVEQKLTGLDPVDLQRYAVLLEQDDWDLFDWLQGRGEPADGDLVALLRVIRAANSADSR